MLHVTYQGAVTVMIICASPITHLVALDTDTWLSIHVLYFFLFMSVCMFNTYYLLMGRKAYCIVNKHLNLNGTL